MRGHFIRKTAITLLLLTAISPLFGEQKKAAAANHDTESLLKEISRGFSRVAKRATPAVVYIESYGVTKQQTVIQPQQRRPKKGPQENPFDYFHDEFFNRFFGYPNNQEQDTQKKSEIVRGSGFIISPDGYIMTNSHVVDKATKVNVTLYGGRKMQASVVGSDPKTDLAVIKIDETNLPFLSFGDSDVLDVGDWTIAIGNPFGLEATVTVGVVSAKGRNQLHITDFEDFIQTDAAINPGNSGGPLLNVEGDVIGINTAIVSGSGGYMGIGFAIPSNMAVRIMDQLISKGSVTRGFLGVTLQPVDEDLAKFYKLKKVEGALITDVIKGSPADQAGLKQEDIILGYNHISVDNLSSFRNAVSLMPAGSPLALRVFRDGKELTLNVTISSLPDEVATASSVGEKLGLEVQNLTPELADQLGYRGEKGIVVTQVQAGSPAADVSIRPGSLILAVNRKKVSTVEEFNLAIQDAMKENRVLLMLRQGEVYRFVALRIE